MTAHRQWYQSRCQAGDERETEAGSVEVERGDEHPRTFGGDLPVFNSVKIWREKSSAFYNGVLRR